MLFSFTHFITLRTSEVTSFIHVIGWIKALLPKSTLSVEEEAWNAYPYTKTRYTSPFVEKFFIEIDTVYCGDPGDQTNVFNLSGNDLRNRSIGKNNLST